MLNSDIIKLLVAAYGVGDTILYLNMQLFIYNKRIKAGESLNWDEQYAKEFYEKSIKELKNKKVHAIY